MSEEWRPVVGWEGWYEVSSEGRVRRVAGGCGASPGRLVKPCVARNGYAFLILSRGQEKKRYSIHRLVLRAFRGEPGVGQQTRHLNGVPTDNRLTNLAWGTAMENQADRCRHGTVLRGTRHPQAILTRQSARVVCALAVRRNLTLRRIGAWFGVTYSTVHCIREGKIWGWATEDIRCA